MVNNIPSWNLTRVYGTWRGANGKLLRGTYRVVLPVRLTNATDDVIVPAGILLSGSLNFTEGAPSLNIQVPATDDPDIEQVGWKMQIVVSFSTNPVHTEVYVLDIPISATNGVNLRQVAMPNNLIDPTTGAMYRVGQPGGLAKLDINGNVIDANGNPITGGGGGGGGGAVTWSSVTNKPATFPPTIGTTSTTALAGNYVPDWSAINNKPSTFPPTTSTTDPLAAKPGNWQPNWTDVQGKPTIPTQFSDLTGVLPTSALPALAINDIFTVASQAAMLALTAQRGDMAIRTDLNTTFVLSTDNPGTLSAWIQITSGAGAVSSVAGKTGSVTLVKADVGLDQVDNVADAQKPVSAAQLAALNGKVDLQYLQTGSGSPEGVATAIWGANYINTANGDVWRKTTASGNTGWVNWTQLIAGLQTQITTLTTQVSNLPKPYMEYNWAFSSSNAGLYSGVNGESRDILLAGTTIIQGPVIRLRDDYGTTALTCDLQYNTGSPDQWVSLYSGALPSIAAGTQAGQGALPGNVVLPQGCGFRVVLPQVPPAATPNSTATTISGFTQVGNGATGNVTSLTFTLPSGATGNAVVVGIVTTPTVTITTPTGWTALDSKSSLDGSGVSNDIKVSIFTAPWSSTLANKFSMTVGPAAGVAALVTSSNPSDLGQLVWGNTTEKTGSSIATPSFSSAFANMDTILYIVGTKINKVDADGWSQAWSNGPTSTALGSQAFTARGSTQAEVGIAIGSSSGPAASGTTPATVTASLTGGSSTVTNTTWLPMALGIKRGPGSHGPSRVTVQVMTQVAGS